jgi:UDP-N-acetylmuramoyl-L-alanyl-D-glutamate--2,6-diaminopimelate ligase
MLLSQIIEQVKTVHVEGALDREVTGITYDSRRVTPGMLFVAVPGQHVDGHDYVLNAVDRGAVAVICQRNGFIQQRATKIMVADAREALAQVAAAFYQHPAGKLKMIGVTGTNGKTTVAFMIKHVLESAGIKTGLLGTIRYEIGERVIPAQRTTPESLDIHQMLSHMVRAGCKACVMEVSSHALEQKRVFGLDFDVAIFTNLTQDHLDYHGTMESYYAAKKKLFSSAAPAPEGRSKASVINIDDTFGARLAKETDAQIRVEYGIEKEAAVRATQIQLGAECTQMTITTPGKAFTCKLPLIGRHNVYNALAAVGASVALEVPPVVIQKALGTVPPVPGRLERIVRGQAFGVLVDYAHTDDALRNVLTTLREITKGRLLLVFGCGGSRDKGKRPKMGRVAAELADVAVITSDNPRKESAADIANQIQEGYRGFSGKDCRIELDRRRAIDDIIRLAQPGDTVLIAGKGHETYQEFEDTVVPFDDRAHAEETLEAMGFVSGRGRRQAGGSR